MTEPTRIAAASLHAWVVRICLCAGLSAEAAEATARLLVRTSLRGIDTHGVARLPSYLQNLETGVFNPAARPAVVENHGVLQCDGEAGIGQHVATVALEAVAARAETQAVVACTLKRCGHLGALGVIALQAAERGLVAVLCQRTGPVIALRGARSRAIGNNPLAFAMPVPGNVPLVFDMAMSEVARGKLVEAARQGTAIIPEGWAIDADGAPTTDVQRALAGAMLPVGGHKGIGLAMLVECLAGSLAGALASQAADGPSGGSTGAFLLVANPRLLAGQALYEASVREWLGHYLSVTGENGRYPGQRQARNEAAREAAGIPMPPSLLGELCDLGNRLGIRFPR